MDETRETKAKREAQVGSQELREIFRLLTGIRRIIQASDRYSRYLADEADVTLPQLVSLLAVVAEQGISTRDLAERVHVSSSTLVGVIDRLEQKGMVERRRDSRDRRLIHLQPTELGRRFAASAPTPLGKSFEAAFSKLPDRRRRQLVKAIEDVADLVAAQARPAS